MVEPTYNLLDKHQKCNQRMAVVAILAAATSTFLALPCFTFEKPYKFVVIGLWAVIPPAWLFYEWFYLLKPAIEDQDANNKHILLEIIKHEQSVVRALWAAFLIALTSIYGVGPFAK